MATTATNTADGIGKVETLDVLAITNTDTYNDGKKLDCECTKDPTHVQLIGNRS